MSILPGQNVHFAYSAHFFIFCTVLNSKTHFKLNFLTFVKHTHTLFELHKFTFPKDPFIKRGVSGVNTLRIFPGTSLDLRTLNLKRAFFKVFAL